MAQHPLVCEPPLISSVKLSQIRLSPPEVVFGVTYSPFCSDQCKGRINESNTNRSTVLKTGQTETPVNTGPSRRSSLRRTASAWLIRASPEANIPLRTISSGESFVLVRDFVQRER